MSTEHWTFRYIGKPYKDKEFDCAVFAEQVLKERFGVYVDLPKQRPAHAMDYVAMAKMVEHFKTEFATPTQSPNEGDGVLMNGRGYNNHIGIYVDMDDEGYVLHNFRKCGGVVLHNIRHLADQGITVEGYYTWLTKE